MKINECMSCGYGNAQVVGTSEGFTELIGKTKFVQEPYAILKCKNCGLYYKDHVLDNNSFSEYYNSFDFKAWAPELHFPTEEAIEKYLLSKSNLEILDYGCSEGRFVSKFVERHTCYGYDIDQRALKIA